MSIVELDGTLPEIVLEWLLGNGKYAVEVSDAAVPFVIIH
jgi:hypothetical protein